MNRIFILGIFMALLASCFAKADQPLPPTETAPQRGYRLLTTKAYVPTGFDQQTFDEIWQVWPEPLRRQALKATPSERREMAFSRYGLTARYGLTGRPGEKQQAPLQYVVDENGRWAANCFSCHGGKVAGRVIAGAPNTHYAMQTFAEDIRASKVRLNKKLTKVDLGSIFFPMGSSVGTTNAVMFGVVLMSLRDAQLNIVPRKPVKLVHHDMDAPAWWLFKKRKRLYVDGYAQKSPRALMQFSLDYDNGPEKFREWEKDFEDIYAYLESLTAPKYPFAIDHELANTGQIVFNRHCARCHGKHGKQESYPNKIIPIQQIGTDRIRLDALSPEYRRGYEASWFAHFGKDTVIADPGGYVAPPLDGIWASAPYLHNGSVPTLWHVLNPSQRPTVWKRTNENGYDQTKVGIEYESFQRVPQDVASFQQLRSYFDTRAFGKSAAGHLFPNKLNNDEKRAVLEYLKTL